MEKYPFYDIVLFIAILSNVLFMSIAIIIIRTKKTSRKNSQILHKVMQLPVVHGQIAVLGPAQQGIRRDDRLQRAARNAGAPAQAGLKGVLRGGGGEDGVVALIQIRGQLAGVGLRRGRRDRS